ncbi:MAG: YbjN domain-containing protein [Cyanobacteria bacterium P01_E01_bin.6]
MTSFSNDASPKSISIEGSLNLYDPEGQSFPLDHASLKLTHSHDRIIDCCLVVILDPLLYQRVASNQLFSLRPELTGPEVGGAIAPDLPVTLTLRLHPEWLPNITNHFSQKQEITTYLQKLAETQPQARLVQTESWLALSITQFTETKEHGYRTLWDYLGGFDPNDESGSATVLTEALGHFIQDSLQATFQDELAQTTADLQQDLADFSQRLGGAGLPPMSQQGLAEMMRGLADIFSQEHDSDTSNHVPSIYEQVQAFFDGDEWPVVEVEPNAILQSTFQGDNGQWLCYAQLQEEHRQLVFYSVLPLRVPDEKQMAIAQFMIRANNGLAIGNFELDFEDGTIRFKTSLRSPNTPLTDDVIRDLIYTNVLTVDQYLPGILQLLYSTTDPAAAIAHVEEKL